MNPDKGEVWSNRTGGPCGSRSRCRCGSGWDGD